MDLKFSRTEMLLGESGLKVLKKCKIAIFGVGGVGSFVAEGLIRSGVGSFVLVDKDDVDITNINRQIHATTKTIGQPKVAVMKERMLSINPDANVLAIKKMFNLETSKELLSQDYTYVIDCIDMVSCKLDLIEQCKNKNIPIISSMGAGNKLDPTLFKVADIYETSVCPLAKVMRRELRKRNIKDLKVVFSTEKPIKTNKCYNDSNNRKLVPGSVAYVPSVVGLIIASEVVKDILMTNKLYFRR